MRRTPATTQHEEAAPSQRRRGLLSFELVLTLPVLGLVLFGLFEFSLLFFARGDMVEAARRGVRKASLPGVTLADVESEVRKSLPVNLQESLQVQVRGGEFSGDTVSVEVWSDMQAAAPDLLWPIGITLQDQQLYAVAHMVRE